MTKKEISAKFAELRKYGYKVFNFSSRRYLSPSFADFTDLVIIKSGFIWFIEIKFLKTKDKLSKGQEDTKEYLQLAEKRNSYVKYYICNEKNYEEIINAIYYLKIN